MYTEIFKNAYKVLKTDKGYLPIRFTQKQFDYYKSLNQAMEYRSRNTAGICMDFYTDAKSISFSYTAGCFSRRYVGFDFYENGIFRKHIEEALDSTHGTFNHTLERDCNKRVTVYIPNLSEVTITDLDIGNFRPVEINTKERLLFLGDSITQGMTTLSPSLAFTTQITNALGAQSLNRGVGSDKYDINLLDEQDEYNPTKIFVALGINDIFSMAQPSEIEIKLNRADAYMEKLRDIYKLAKVYIITPIWCLRLEEDVAFKKLFDKYSKELTKLAQKHGFIAIDGYNLVPHKTKYFQDLSVHPSDSGFNHYADNLLNAIK